MFGDPYNDVLPLLFLVVLPIIGALSALVLQTGFSLWASPAPKPTVGGPAGAGVPSGATLRIGDMPRGDDVFLLTLAAHGRQRLADVLIDAARADGWLDETLVPLRDATPSSPALRRFHDEMVRASPSRSRSAAVEAAAERTAGLLAKDYAVRLDALGFRHTPPTRLGIALIPLVIGAALCGLAWRTGDPMLTVFCTLIAGGLFTALAVRSPAPNGLRRYLGFLQDSTRALSASQAQGVSLPPDEAALVAALAGHKNRWSLMRRRAT